MDKKSLIKTRDYENDDYNFILATWLRGLYYGNEWFNRIDKTVFMKNYHKVIDHLLKKPFIKINVSCLVEDPSVILGYCVSEPEILHWVFVKQPWRGIGIARDLIPHDITTVTHLTKCKLKPDIKFNPFLV
jgi:hypothetical protein